MSSLKAHAKYLLRVLWGPLSSASVGSHCIFTASPDQSLGVFRWTARQGEDSASLSVATDGGEGAPGIAEVYRVPYTSAVQDMVMLRGGCTLVVAVKGTNYLRLLEIDKLLEAREVEEGNKDLSVDVLISHD